jgi:chemotaxis signal transduction protein
MDLSGMKSYYIGFTVGDYHLALQADNLERVLPAAAIQLVPANVPACLGVLVVESQVVPVLSGHTLLGLTSKAIHPDDHFLLVNRHFSESKTIRLLIHVEHLLGLLKPDDAEISEQHIPQGNGMVVVRSLKSHWGLLTVLAQDELLAGLDIQQLIGLIEETPS